MKRSVRSPHRRRPHILPPLSVPKEAPSSPMEPLQPPSAFIGMEGRLGSPVPRWHRPHLEDLEFEPTPGGKPGIRITPCLDQDGSSLGGDLRKDPHYQMDAGRDLDIQRRNSMKTLGLFNKSSPLSAAKPKGPLPNRFAPLKPINWRTNEN